MSAQMLVIVACLAGAAVGVVAAVIVGKVKDLSMPIIIGAAVGLGAIGAGAGWFIARQDLVPGQQFAEARQGAETMPDVQVLKQYYPADYAKLQNDLDLIQDKRLGQLGVLSAIQSSANTVMLREARKASDENLLKLMQLRRDKAEALRAKSPAWCYDFTRGARLTFDPSAAVGPDLVARERQITSDILKQVAVAPVTDAAGNEKNDYKLSTRRKQYFQVELRDQVSARARSGFAADEQETIVMLSGRKVSLSDAPRQSLMCRYNIALLDETLKLEPETAAMIYRLNLGKGL
jgi:hypothetical protein